MDDSMFMMILLQKHAEYDAETRRNAPRYSASASCSEAVSAWFRV